MRHVTDADIAYLARNLKDVDRAEVFHTMGEQPFEGILASVRSSDSSYALSHAGKPAVAIGGHSTCAQGTLVWLLTDNDVRRYASSLTRVTREILRGLQGKRLYNYVLKANRTSVQWLQYLEFTQDGTFDINGEIFLKMRRYL